MKPLTLASAVLVLLGCVSQKPATIQTVSSIESELDGAFRIDLSHIDVTYDIDFGRDIVRGRAELRFRMRPGQELALFHFNPQLESGTARDALTSLSLDGEPVRLDQDAELREVRFPGSSEVAFELGRPLAPGIEHALEIAWTLDGLFSLRGEDWFRSDVDDCTGDGNEWLWPTINSPEELARHTIRLRIHDEREYVGVGSGTVTKSVDRRAGEPQIFEFDSGREISSYTMMVAALPADETQVDRFEIDGIPVTICATVSDEEIATSREIIAETLPALVLDFGPYPAPGLQVLLLDWDDGMEYFGATITGLGALEHELAHMYWGCSAIGQTWRDTWLDEALAVWWTERDDLDELPPGYTSNMVSSRTPIESAFDLRAYDEGASMMAETSAALGGDEVMMAFLKDFHSRRSFAPFTTEEFVADLIATTGDESHRERFDRWLKAPRTSTAEENFESIWNTFQKNYAFFELRGVDWDEQYELHRPRVSQATTDIELFAVLSDLLRSLGDSHVTLERTDGSEFSSGSEPRFYEEFDDEGIDELEAVTLATLERSGFHPIRDETRLFGVSKSNRFGYLRVSEFEGPSERKVHDALTRILRSVADCEGLIVDVRDNPGGDDWLAYAIANRFTAKEQVGHYKMTKTGPGENEFGPRETWMLKPEGPEQYTGPIVLLTNDASFSAADVFALAMDQLAHVTIVGEPTHGIFSDMFEAELPNGWFYTLSHQRYFSPDGVCFEGRGVPVDLEVQNSRNDLATDEDSVLATALSFLVETCKSD